MFYFIAVIFGITLLAAASSRVVPHDNTRPPPYSVCPDSDPQCPKPSDE